MALPNSNISISMVRNELGESSNDLSVLCKSDKINQWALYKPAEYKYGGDAHSGEDPVGKLNSTSRCRLGDFRMYNKNAKPPIRLQRPSVTITGYKDVPSGASYYSAYLVRDGAEMKPTANNDGFNPDYVKYVFGVDESLVRVRYRCEIWSSILLLTGAYYEESWTEEGMGLPAVTVGELSGSYKVRIKQQASYNNQWYDRGYIDGGDGTISVTTTEYFTVTAYLSVDEFSTNKVRLHLTIRAKNSTDEISLKLIPKRYTGSGYENYGDPIYKNSLVPGTYEYDIPVPNGHVSPTYALVEIRSDATNHHYTTANVRANPEIT